MKRLLPILLLAAFPLFAVEVGFIDLRNVMLDRANAGCLSDVKANYAKNWKEISSAVTLKVRENCSNTNLTQAAIRQQVADAEACGLVIPDADKADIARLK